MHKTKNKTSYTLYALHIPVAAAIAVAVVVGGGYALNTQLNKAEESNVLSQKDNSSKNKENKSDKSINKANNSNKDKTKNEPASPQAKTYKKSVDDVVETLTEVAESEKKKGYTAISETLEEISEETEEIADETAEAMEALEKRSKWRTLLFGTDYKNLGQLRSSLAHNENAIRKLTRTQEAAQSTESAAQVREQLGELEQERERIREIIQENESQFSILGWIKRLFSGFSGGDNDTDESTESTST